MLWLATWRDLASTEWFASVGRREHTTVHYVDSWESAVMEATAATYDDLKLAAANGFRRKLAEVTVGSDIGGWNQVVREIKRVVEQEIEERVGRVRIRNDLKGELVSVVKWDVVGGLAQAAFYDYVPNGFYLGLLYWYRAGHFPCGWRGVHPQGRLVIY